MAIRRILLVEGPDDAHVVKHICGTRGLPHLDDVNSHGGIVLLLESLPVRLKASEDGDIVGVMIDANSDIAARWQAFRNRVIESGYESVPPGPSPSGTILDPPPGTLLPRLGIWVMPDNKSEGILEDFLTFLVPTGSGLFEHVESCVKSIPDGERRFSPAAVPKALIHTWLAWQEKPGKPLGTAITARYLDPDVPQVDGLISWLRSLYDFPSSSG